ncbi:hypothetical protein [Rouxiella sp. WC2420]|uniref:Tail spike TSP1/Gp66 N-terminal domain-containing protein n=1 Tax=Rouxiella sp. WC2420 TaxID=3234145 RepID=A0AB39VMQ2_9GAMM
MSSSYDQSAKKWASQAEVSASVSQSAATDALKAPAYADEAAAHATAAAASADTAQQSVTIASSSASSAAQSASQAAATLSGAVKGGNTFTSGATLNSVLDQINDGTNLYYWTGAFPKVVPANSTPETSGGIASGAWAVAGDVVLRSTLKSAAGADNVMGNATNSVSEILKKVMTLSDIGVNLPYLGYDSTNDLLVIKVQEALSDTTLLHVGNLSISHTPSGITRGATGLSVRSGRPDSLANDASGLVPQVTGITSAETLYDIPTVDGVALYADYTLTPRQSWKSVSSCTYTENTCTFSSADSVAAEQIKTGAILFTNHDPVVVNKNWPPR